jgi:hypothetical protein
VEDNVLTFATHWTGTGTIENTGDAERVALDATEYMESAVVHVGTLTTEILQNHYQAGDTVTLKYRHGASEAACLAASYVTYTIPFMCLGYVQVRIEYL